jgi:ATP-dependent helicase HrpA
LIDAVLKLVRLATSLDVMRADIKADMLSPHFFMNFRVVDEHGRQLGHGRNLGALKSELGAQARGAFQALAGLKLASAAVAQPAFTANQAVARVNSSKEAIKNAAPPPAPAGQRYTAWTFGELPELLEIQKGGQTLVGYPALIDASDAVTIEVFDEPDVAAARHRAGLRRLFALQIRDALKYLEKNIPELQKMAVIFMQVGKSADGSGGGTVEELREQIIAVALDRAFLLDPLPTNAFDFSQTVEEGRGRLTLIANEVARLANSILLEYAIGARKIKET